MVSAVAMLYGGIVGHINEITEQQAGLELIWVIILGYTVLVFNQANSVCSIILH